MTRAVVLVLGDLGRSPRMQYHASSLSHHDKITSVIQVGYTGEKVMVDNNASVSEIRFTPWEFDVFRKVPILHAVLKGVGLLVKIFVTLLMLPTYSVIIIQNPPCLPALIAAYMMSIFNGSTIIIDWHNLGYAMFAQRLGSDHILVKLARYLEKVICRLAHKHICVSEAMKDWLAEHFSVKAVVLYDRPARIFSTTSPSLQQRHCLLSSLEYRDDILFPSLIKLATKGDPSANQTSDDTGILSGELSTCQTDIDNVIRSNDAGVKGGLTLCNDRAKIVVSATSWTEDEDFSVLLEALQELDQILLASSSAKNERLLVVITGKGPLKAAFEECVCDLTARGLLQRVAVKTAWLSPENYSLLLRCADLGICLHTSSSGLDLPMKVLDMFGSGLPVCAVRFPTIHELVNHGRNGMIFDTAGGLTEQIVLLLFPEIARNRHTKSKLMEGASRSSSLDECEDSDQNDVDTWCDRGIASDCTLGCRQEEQVIFTNALQGVTLLALQSGARQIGSWDDNWGSVMKPLVTEWTKQRSLV